MTMRGPCIELKALYSFTDLARLAGLTRHQVRRLCKRNAVETVSIGKKTYVPLAAFEVAFPTLWRSMQRVQQLASGR
jgi:hypothetical protein